MKVAFYLAFGLLFGLVLSALVSFNVWLDMRVHSYQVVWFGIFCSILFKNAIKIWYIFVLEMALLLLSFCGKSSVILYNFKESLVVVDSLNLSNLAFVLFLVVLNFACFIAIFRRKKLFKK
ncbi:hypothetical protein [Campylobacter geochelonis]|uniref:Uncharacterized protein n=1 Tax=Campylobacter geochelonis TaxID=1780362 RepID=A0A128EAF2_9BACT|nr:hypothetical protein [Campylobacter geochelonis]QKF70602.1 putative membrane protein [Campylobacter geochelonis]CZE45950.1 Uncharacterised protein [Campylobacter geochelonis]